MTETLIHPTAVIHRRAELAADVEVGPYCVVGADVTIGTGTRLGPHVHLEGEATFGERNIIGTGATLGLPPQHTAYRGAPTRLVVGSGNTFREYVNVHRGYQEGNATVIGNDCYLMASAHVGHDCRLGDGIIIANAALLGGHVTVGDRAFISAQVVVHQFCAIGRLVMISGMSGLNRDIPPFMIASGRPAPIRALNRVGLQRAGFSVPLRAELKRIFQALYRSGRPLLEVLRELAAEDLPAECRELVDFYQHSKRGVTAFVPWSSRAVNLSGTEDG